MRIALTEQVRRLPDAVAPLLPAGLRHHRLATSWGILALLAAELSLLLLANFVDATVGLLLAFGLLYSVLCWYSLPIAWLVVFTVIPLSREIAFDLVQSAMWIPTEPMLLLFLAIWIIFALFGWRVEAKWTPILGSLMALAAVAAMSIIFSNYLFLSVKAFLGATWLIGFGFLFPFLADRDGELLRRGSFVLALATVALSVYGLLYLAQHGVSRAAGSAMGRPFFPEHGTYSSYLSFGGALLLSLGVLGTTAQRRALGLIGFGIVLLAITLSVTRAAYLGMGGVLIVFALYLLRRRTIVPLLAAFVLLMGTLTVLGRFEAGEFVQLHASSIMDPNEPSNMGRINRWLAAVNMVREHPLLGVGYGAYEDSYFSYRVLTLRSEERFQRVGVHSEYLEVLAEMGVIGFAALLTFLWFVFREGHRAIQWHRSRRNGWLALGATAGVASYVVHGVFNQYSFTDKVGIPFWFLVAVIAVLAVQARRDAASSRRE